MKYKRRAHGIEITKRYGEPPGIERRELLRDKEGVMVFTSKAKAADAAKAQRAAGRFMETANPKIVPLSLIIEKV